jgi:hypothetical protein
MAESSDVSTRPLLPACTRYGNYPAATYGQYSNAPSPVTPPLDPSVNCLPYKDGDGNVLATGKLFSDPSLGLAFTQYDHYNTLPRTGRASHYLRDGCEWMPMPAAGSQQVTDSLPLVVFLHPSMTTPDVLDGELPSWGTPSLLQYIATPDLIKPGQPGFVLMAPQGRITYHYYKYDSTYGNDLISTNPSTGMPLVDVANYLRASVGHDLVNTGWDVWNRNVKKLPYTTVERLANLDIVALDHFIDEELKKTMLVNRNGRVVRVPKIDRKRIYLVGWSNGGQLAWLYGLNRNNIAGLGLYSSSNPYAVHNDPCEQIPVSRLPWRDTTPVSQLPMPNPDLLLYRPPHVLISSPDTPAYHIHNYCDIGGTAPNVDEFHQRLAREGNRNIEDVTIQWQMTQKGDPDQLRVRSGQYDRTCGSNINADGPYPDLYETSTGTMNGFVNHQRWPHQWMVHRDPSGNDDGAGMFAFFNKHPLDQRSR